MSFNKHFQLCLNNILYCISHTNSHFYSNQQHKLNKRFYSRQWSNFRNFHDKRHIRIIRQFRHYRKDMLINISFRYFNSNSKEYWIKELGSSNNKYSQVNISSNFLYITNKQQLNLHHKHIHRNSQSHRSKTCIIKFNNLLFV